MATNRPMIPTEPTPSSSYFRPSPLPAEPFPDSADLGYLVLLADTPSLSLEDMDALSEAERLQMALSPLDLVVGGVATPDSLLGRGLLADAQERFRTNQSRDEFGLLTVGLMYLETGAGLDRRTYDPADLMLHSLVECRPGSQWRPTLAKRFSTVPDRWIRL